MATCDGEFTPEYRYYSDMKSRLRRNAAYKDYTLSEAFESFQFFAEWCNRQVGFDCRDDNGELFALDKDILSPSKVYSEDTCVFVPRRINGFMVDHRSRRGAYPIGVDFNKRAQKYRARCADTYGGSAWLGWYESADAAHLAYKRKKEELAKLLASQYKGRVDERVVEALSNFTVTSDGFSAIAPS
jgi:hypothetical protein